MRSAKGLYNLLPFLAILALAGCGSSARQMQQSMGTVFLAGTDAPLANVVSFQVTITGLTLSNGFNSTPVSALSRPETVEFSQLNGLDTLLTINPVPAGTYTTASIMLSSPVLTYLDTSVSPPAVKSFNPTTLTQSSLTLSFAFPVNVTQDMPTGLLLDFNLNKSIEVDSSGQVTGVVNPQLSLSLIHPAPPLVTCPPCLTAAFIIDEVRGEVVSVNSPMGSFVLQTPNGHQFSVQTSSQTLFSSGDSLSSLNASTIVEVVGALNTVTLMVNAIEVDVISQNSFGIVGLITFVRPPTGNASQIQVLIRDVVPPLPNVTVGQIFPVNLTGSEKYLISLGFPKLVLPPNVSFGPSSLVAGQQVAIGGSLDTSTSPPTLVPQRLVLEQEGFVGDWVPGSTNTSAGTFSFTGNGLAGVLLPQPLTVDTTPGTGPVGTQPILFRVTGPVMLDPTTAKAVIVARDVALFP